MLRRDLEAQYRPSPEDSMMVDDLAEQLVADLLKSCYVRGVVELSQSELIVDVQSELGRERVEPTQTGAPAGIHRGVSFDWNVQIRDN